MSPRHLLIFRRGRSPGGGHWGEGVTADEIADYELRAATSQIEPFARASTKLAVAAPMSRQFGSFLIWNSPTPANSAVGMDGHYLRVFDIFFQHHLFGRLEVCNILSQLWICRPFSVGEAKAGIKIPKG